MSGNGQDIKSHAIASERTALQPIENQRRHKCVNSQSASGTSTRAQACEDTKKDSGKQCTEC
eukprot:CAMPEP_0204236964 /NCGR_PEP_ID=MMETSP0361-20130328/92888_1 /ASSEMBLY_ACC=CAM_ASM_000343 /TAXON_ID=268821 /ORGANISM="Scrippsiella Hangoei, Strain SHTV-5" /LENGTH=61 /DNA_ID=CAMNT_0051209251 /DNA_START=28 /DNA_END=210 /DNA_ORIENTATION=-